MPNIKVTVDKNILLERLVNNRAAHKKVYEKALNIWQNDLEKCLKTIVPSKVASWPHLIDDLRNSLPVSYIKDYDEAIDMFELSVDKTITLEHSSFVKFCRDEWNWRRDLDSNRYYLEATNLD